VSEASEHIQYFGASNTLDPGFHLPARSRFGEGRQVRRIGGNFFTDSGE
jgi:hypothetical protein